MSPGNYRSWSSGRSLLSLSGPNGIGNQLCLTSEGTIFQRRFTCYRMMTSSKYLSCLQLCDGGLYSLRKELLFDMR